MIWRKLVENKKCPTDAEMWGLGEWGLSGE